MYIGKLFWLVNGLLNLRFDNLNFEAEEKNCDFDFVQCGLFYGGHCFSSGNQDVAPGRLDFCGEPIASQMALLVDCEFLSFADIRLKLDLSGVFLFNFPLWVNALV